MKDWIRLEDTYVFLRDVTSFQRIGVKEGELKVRLRCGTVLTFHGDLIHDLRDAFGLTSSESA